MTSHNAGFYKGASGRCSSSSAWSRRVLSSLRPAERRLSGEQRRSGSAPCWEQREEEQEEERGEGLEEEGGREEKEELFPEAGGAWRRCSQEGGGAGGDRRVEKKRNLRKDSHIKRTESYGTATESEVKLLPFRTNNFDFFF